MTKGAFSKDYEYTVDNSQYGRFLGCNAGIGNRIIGS